MTSFAPKWRKRRENFRDKRFVTKSGKLSRNPFFIIKANSPMKPVTKNWPNALDKIDKERGTRGNRLFYLAVAPDQFEPILKNLESRRIESGRQKEAGRASSSKNRSAPISPRRASSIASCTIHFPKNKLTGSIIFSGKRPRKTFSSCGSPTPFSSRSGTRATSITSRSPPRKRSGWRDAPVTTKARAPCATWCKIICSNCSASSRWKRRPISAPTAFAMKK